MLRIRDVYSGSEFLSIPDTNSSFHPESRIRIKEFRYFNPKNLFLSSRKYDLGCSSRIRILCFYPYRIPDAGVKKASDPGSGSATLIFLQATILYQVLCQDDKLLSFMLFCVIKIIENWMIILAGKSKKFNGVPLHPHARLLPQSSEL